MTLPVLLLALGCKKPPITTAAAAQASACDRPTGMFGPVALAGGDDRYGEGVRSLSEAKTSKEQPIEVCSVRGQLAWLMQAQCEDGSQPFTDPGSAHASRVGNVGPGGRCESVIDLYQVPCPEGEVAVYMDLYMCRDGEEF